MYKRFFAPVCIDKGYRRPTKWLCRLLFTLLAAVFCAGCRAEPSFDENRSPRLARYFLTSSHQGTEESQKVTLSLFFDRPIALSGDAAEHLRVTVAGNRVEAGKLRWALSGEAGQSAEAAIEFNLEYMYNGKLEVGALKEDDPFMGVADAGGEYAAAAFHVSALVPSGVTLETVSADYEKANVVKAVTDRWHIRGIAWVHLLLDGETVYSALPESPETLDGAVAVHGHDFLTESESDIALSICERLTHFFGEDYLFEAERERVSVTKKEPGDGAEPDLRIYQY